MEQPTTTTDTAGNGKVNGRTNDSGKGHRAPEKSGRLSASMKRAHAKRKGPWKLSDAKIARILKLRRDGFTVEAIAKREEIAVSTAHRYLSEAKQTKVRRRPNEKPNKPDTQADFTVPARVLSWFRDARRQSYAEVRAGREFTTSEHFWMIGYDRLMSMDHTDSD